MKIWNTEEITLGIKNENHYPEDSVEPLLNFSYTVENWKCDISSCTAEFKMIYFSQDGKENPAVHGDFIVNVDFNKIKIEDDSDLFMIVRVAIIRSIAILAEKVLRPIKAHPSIRKNECLTYHEIQELIAA